MLQTNSRASSSLKSKYLQKFDGLTLQNLPDDSDDDDGNDEPTFFIDSKPCVEPEAGRVRRKTKERTKLASELSPGINLCDTYVAVRDGEQATKAAQKVKELVLQSSADSLLQGSVLAPGFEKRDSVPPYTESLRRIKAQRKEERSKTKGPGWFGLPAPEMTDELKRDLEVLRMRHVLDPKRFYKRNDLKDLPKYFQVESGVQDDALVVVPSVTDSYYMFAPFGTYHVGTVMDSAADFYHARVPKKDRKQTMVEELLADAEFRRFNKKKFNEAMARQQRGVSQKALKHMKRLKKRKT